MHTLGILGYWANFHCCKWPNVEEYGSHLITLLILLRKWHLLQRKLAPDFSFLKLSSFSQLYWMLQRSTIGLRYDACRPFQSLAKNVSKIILKPEVSSAWEGRRPPRPRWPARFSFHSHRTSENPSPFNIKKKKFQNKWANLGLF